VETALAENACVIALSTLMTTTMDAMVEVIQLLEAAKVRERFKVIVGGGPISQSFADRIGADGYASGAPGAVKLVEELVGQAGWRGGASA
jgi:methanogenic corrinoid protein MtbC1